MFKKKLLAIIVCILMAFNSALFVACNGNDGGECVHQWGEWESTVDVTCTTDGTKRRDCINCEEYETEVVTALGHDWQAATCSSPKKCKNCLITSGSKAAHSYIEQIVKPEALKSEATCTRYALYYLSCACGQIGNFGTFTAGEKLQHVYDQQVEKLAALKTAGTCTSSAVYYKSCSCGKVGSVETFESGGVVHDYSQEVVKGEALKSAATCLSPAIYYKSCTCGAVSPDETFTSGRELDHEYNQEVVALEALKSEATCYEAAVYYKSCTCGAISDTDTFTVGTVVHVYDQELVIADALKTQGTGSERSVYYKSCTCGAISPDETFIVKTMVGKNVLIFGDSYSSYVGTIPAGQSVYYTGSNILNSPDQMWWNLLVEERGGTIIRNDSSSGSTIGYTGYNGGDTSKSIHSFIYRLEKLIESGYFENNQIDYVYVLGGTNDSWANAPLGEELYLGWTKEDLYNVLPAVCYFFIRLREVLPNAEIYGIANHLRVKQEIIDAISHVCGYIGGKAVILQNITTESSHPNIQGMIQIKNQVLTVFDQN